EIKKIQDELLEIVGEIGKIKVKIDKLEVNKKDYQEMLSDAEHYKRILEERYEDEQLQLKNNILNSLYSLYKITSAEG
ncbi:MAG: hypothetical protein Q8879_01790, partial [Candidatus Phytoplasma australasiaticum]|nr:hypothetical protein [Candidatus Phytoplasma australasiaticum]